MCSPASTTFDAAYRTARRTCFWWTMLCPSHLALDPAQWIRIASTSALSVSPAIGPSRASSEASSSLDAIASLDAIERWWIQTIGSFASRLIFPSSSARGNHFHLLGTDIHSHPFVWSGLECEALTSPSRNTCVVLSPAPRRTSECE
ncbi:hypothetical protein B0H14DRAFT_3875102 [Mycena olivaceomarginata]|nr:hypothetical protein B0H14DRAFT_3875102 [Mycena olivaceomarginata]